MSGVSLNRLRRAHRWVGLALGLLWTVQGLTGAALAFRREIDRFGIGPIVGGPILPVDALLQRAARLLPKADLLRIGFVDQHRQVIEVLYRLGGPDRRALYLEGSTGRLLADRPFDGASPWHGGFWRWLYDIHHALGVGASGQAVIGVSGVFLLATVIVGLVLSFKRSGTVSRGRVSPRAAMIHRSAGMAVAPILILVAATGIGLAFDAPLRHLLEHRVPTRPTDQVAVRPVSAGTALAVALARYPNSTLARLTLPMSGAPWFDVRLRRPGEARVWLGTTSVVVDAQRGTVISSRDARKAPLASRVLDSLYPVHQGEFGEKLGQLATMLCGIAIATLAATAFASWMRR